MDGIYNSLKMEEITDQFDASEIEGQKALTIISLIFSILFFLPAVSNKESLFAKEISNQLFTIFIAGLVNSLIITNIPVIGAILGGLISLIIFILIIFKIVDAVNCKVRKLPFGVSLNIFK